MKKFIGFITIVMMVLWGCSTDTVQSSGGIDVNSGTQSVDILTMPTITPAAGDYSASFIEVSLSAGSGAEIYYTTDGTAPTEQSNRYTGPFKIIGSKTVRALYVSNGKISAISNAIYNLNVGKSSTQLGSIKGTVGLSNKISASMLSQLSITESHNDVDVYITSPEMPGVVQKTQVGKSFRIDGMNSNKIYPLYFTNIEPGPVISSSRGDNTKPVVALKIEVQPEEGDGVDVGEVELKPTGSITGTAKKYADDGTEETDHTGITVFIPGTSFSAYTDKNGSFSMTGVPQGLHVIRAMFAGYTFSEKENIMLSSDDDSEPRTVIADSFELYYAKGTLKGSVILSDSENGNSGVDIVISEATGKYSSTAVTQANGSWLINDVTPGTYSVEIHKDGYVDQTINDIIVTGAKITTVPRVVLKFDGGTISGIVSVGQFGNVAGVSVLAEKITDEGSAVKTYYAITNALGEFIFDAVIPGLYTVTATYAGYKSVNQSNISVSINDEIKLTELKISEKSTYSVTGSCLLSGMDSGFEGTSVLLQSTSNENISKSTTTNTVGVYTISDIDAGNYILTFSRQGFITNNILTVEVGTKAIEVLESVVLKSNAGIVTGTVTLESAETSEGIAILISKENDEKTYSTVTDSTGHFAVAGIAPGTYRVQATKNGYTTGISDPFAVFSGEITSPSDIELKISLRSLYGTVTLEGRTDYTGVSITATKTTSTTEIYSALSNKEGFYALSGMTPGEYILSFSFEGYISPDNVYASLLEESSVNLDELELSKATGVISGIVNLEGSTDHSGIVVTLVGTNRTYTTKSDGVYSFTVPTGSYIGGVRFEKEGYQLTVKGETLIVLADQNNEVVKVTLKSDKGIVTSSVTLESAAEHDGIDIIVYKEDDTTVIYSSATDSEGHFAIANVMPGTYRIQATKQGFTVGKSDPFIVSGGATVTPPSMQLSISRRALYGTVTLEGRTDYTGVRITATKTTSTTEIYSALSNKDGFYALSGMTPGEYILSFSFEGYRSYTSPSISLSSDSSLNLDAVELNKATGHISGIVNLEGCTDHSGITVSIVGTDYSFITEANGEYQFTVPSGNYPGGVRFEKTDYQLTAKAETIPVLTDSTYGVTTAEMKATANTIKGIIDLAGSEDDSGIAVTIDEYADVEAAISLQDGSWTLYHVPVDTERFVTLRFKRENTPDVTKQIKVIANDFVDAGALEMIPNSASLTGHVFLTGMTEHNNILVTVTTDGKDDITVQTASDGKFYVSNILATGGHNITFSKDGWNSQTIVISDFEPLEIRDIDEIQNISLVDTTAPVLSSVVIEDGANTTNSAALSIKINAAESGSGISKMAVQIKAPEYDSLYPSVWDWQDYKSAFTKDLSELPKAVYTGNGEYIVYITLKDAAGNVSETVNDKIVVTDQVTILKGVLTGSDLTLTKAKSPYRVESNILVDEGAVLTIEAGTQIEFAGDYFLKVNGEINAIGTKEDKIVIKGIDDNICARISFSNLAVPLQTENTYTYLAGSIFKYVVGKNSIFSCCAFIDSCEFGSLSINSSSIVMNSSIGYLGCGARCYIINNIISNGALISSANDRLPSCKSYVISNIISNGVFMRGQVDFINNTIKNSLVSLNDSSLYNKVNNNIFENSYFSIGYDGFIEINNNSFFDSPKKLIDVKDTRYTYIKIINFTNNYWDIENTEELNLIGNNANASFIYDYYDNFESSKIDYSNWATEPIAGAGYQGDDFCRSFIAFYYTINGDADIEYYVNSYSYSSSELSIVINPQFHANDIVAVRVAKSIAELESTSWNEYNANQSWTLDMDNLNNGDVVNIYVQLKDSEGNISSPVMHKVYYNE